jgi:hypothetical protein
VQSRTEIWNEIKEISPLVAGISSAGVFTVPQNYFDTLSDNIINRVFTEVLPADEERQSAAIAGAQFVKNMPYSIPSNYLEEFAENILIRIQTENASSAEEELDILSPLLKGIDKKNPFSVPQGFFTELADTMNSGVQAIEFVNNELENFSPLISGLKEKNVYETPDSYFENFSDSVFEKIKQQVQPAKVISINKKRNWFKYAAAAAVIGIIAAGSLLVIDNRNSQNRQNAAVSLASVSDQEMMNYLEDQSTPQVSADSSATNNSVASADLNDTDANDLLSDVSDDELQQYVDDNAATKDLIMN